VEEEEQQQEEEEEEERVVLHMEHLPLRPLPRHHHRLRRPSRHRSRIPTRELLWATMCDKLGFLICALSSRIHEFFPFFPQSTTLHTHVTQHYCIHPCMHECKYNHFVGCRVYT
jgi:hypothetical protein